ncbi:MAG: ferritin-like domain-containing protein [Gammaproteobacteria bacterium]|nr:ferritin-like domain-containing protein [Gammaproteobacteria bacterium]
MSEPIGDFEAEVLGALKASEAGEKLEIVQRLLEVEFISGDRHTADRDLPLPGYPDRLRLVDPREVPRRSLGTIEGRACFLHAIAHIEFNAINLALDAVYRFGGLPDGYYRDWLEVARDEACHHAMLEDRLEELGYRYGDFPAHNGLWDVACRTAHDLVSRMAMVPCVMEARGLDVTPGMIRRFRDMGDDRSAGLLETILEEEERHVAIGVAWYRWACGERGLDPVPTFFSLLETYLPHRLSGPLNIDRRRAAGFDDAWLRHLESAARPVQDRTNTAVPVKNRSQ